MNYQSKNERIQNRKKEMGSRTDRKLRKYSNNFEEIFSFYFLLYRTGLITFCGSDFKADFSLSADEAKFVFREYDNGRYKQINPITRHPNILNAVIIGKKGWGLWVKQWSEGIADWCFTEEEIFEEFKKRNINIPSAMLLELQNSIFKAKKKRYK